MTGTIAIAVGISLFAGLFMLVFYKLAIRYLPESGDAGSRERAHKDIPETAHEVEDHYYSEAK